MTGKIKIGMSSCLLGNKVRYDGGHQYQANIIKALGTEFELLPFCPELAIGLGVPRPKIQLVETGGLITCMDESTHTLDYTDKLSSCCDQQMQWLSQINGYIFKTKSPSCGLSKVKTDHQGVIKADGRGIFAQRLLELLPHLPTIEEDQFDIIERRSRFLRAVLDYQ